ncbi:sugar phosphate isomerase/epimerase [soil metagenome]
MNRRKFIGSSAASLAAAGLFSQLPASLYARGSKAVKIPIGFQSYVLRTEINDDLTGILKKMVSFGYEQVEMCSPFGYAPGNFANLTKYTGKELKNMISDTGISCYSSHFTMNELKNNLDERIAFAQDMGLKHMVCSGGLDGKTIEELKTKCASMNLIGEKIKKAGMVAGYHNHTGEFENKKDGRPDYDIILEELNPEFVKMQFQVAAIQAGAKAADYFRKYPGRFISSHLSDFSKTDIQKQVVLGQESIVDWKDFFDAAKTGGLKWVFVEMEQDPGTLEGSVKYLKNL